MEKLTDKKCVPCEGGIDPLTEEEYKPYLQIIDNWSKDKTFDLTVQNKTK